MRLLNGRKAAPVALCCLLILSSSLRAAVTVDSATGTTAVTSHVGPTISPTLTAQLAAVEKLPTTDPTNLPEAGRGSYFSAQRPLDPPAPGNIFSQQVWELEDDVYLLDDVDFNYQEAAATYQANMATAMVVSGPPAPGSGGGTNGGGGTPYLAQVFTTNQLWLQVATTNIGGTNLTAYLTINTPWNVTGGVYDLFATTNLVGTWQWVTRCLPGQTNLTVPNLGNPLEFFILGLTNDSTGCGMTDAYKLLVAHLNPLFIRTTAPA